MLAKKVQDAMNAQLAIELESAYAYLAMAAYCEEESLPGFGTWLREQAREEVAHAMRFFDFITDRDGHVALRKLPEPRQKFSSVLDVFERALDNERSVTRSISDLYGFVVGEKDYAAQAWLDWFATEQVEEEKSVGHIVDSLRRIGESGDALFLLDREVGQRGPVAGDAG